jgi:ligand-binding sensor domain-containing protein
MAVASCSLGVSMRCFGSAMQVQQLIWIARTIDANISQDHWQISNACAAVEIRINVGCIWQVLCNFLKMMKNSTISAYLLLQLLVAIALCSCKTQGKPSTTEEHAPAMTSTQRNDTTPVSEYIVEIFEDKQGNLWYGTVTDGVVRYDGKQLTYLSTRDGLVDNTVPGIAQDAKGNMWFGTHAGVSRFDGKTFTNYTESQGLRGSGCKLLVDRKGRLWAGTTEGAFQWNGTSFAEFKLPNPVIAKPSYKMKPGKIWSISDDKKGNIWFARDGFGACKYDGSTFTHFTQEDGLCSNNVTQVVEDNQGNLWFSSITSDFPEYIQEGGVSRYDGKTITQFPELQGLTRNDIYTLYKANAGDIWMCGLGVGAYRYDGNRFDFFKDIDGKHDLIKYFGMQSMLEDRKGRLWCGFSGGLFRFDGKSFKHVSKAGPWD